MGATSAPCPADEPSTAVIIGTWPEQRDCASRSVGARPYALPSARNPAPSSIITRGTRSRTASSAARYRLELLVWLIVPASTVKSSAATMTGRPPTRPDPSTIASAGTSSPPVSVPSSRNEPGSTSASTRARASSFPAPWCLARRASPPMERPATRRSSRSARVAFQSSGSRDVRHRVSPPARRSARVRRRRLAPTMTPVTPGGTIAARLPLLADARRVIRPACLRACTRRAWPRSPRRAVRPGTAPGCAPPPSRSRAWPSPARGSCATRCPSRPRRWRGTAAGGRASPARRR